MAVGLPAELLRRRPDVRAAEINAAAEGARIGVAEADLYPRFFLFGEIGVQASDAAKLFAPGSLFLTAGPGFRWSILNYGRITNNVRSQDARFQQAFVNYEDTVLRAAREVEDALIGFLKAQERAVNLQRSVDAAQRALDLSFIQYREGAENFQRVIDSQTRLLTERNRLAETRSTIATNLIARLQSAGRWMGNPRRQADRVRSDAGANGEPHGLGQFVAATTAAETRRLKPAAASQRYASRAPTRLVS